MILKSLVQYYDNFAKAGLVGIGQMPTSPIMSEIGYSARGISHLIILEKSGEVRRFEDIRTPKTGGKPGNKTIPVRFIVPGVLASHSNGVDPNYLWDNVVYTTGFPAKEGNQTEATLKRFQATTQLHLAAELTIGDDEYSIVCEFFRTWQKQMSNPYAIPGFKIFQEEGGSAIFKIADSTNCVYERPAFKAFWANNHHLHSGVVLQPHQTPSQMSQNPPSASTFVHGQCLITGHYGPLARLHEPGIKLDPMGIKLTSCNIDSAISHHMTAKTGIGTVAPIGVEASFKYCTALNHLIEDASPSQWLMIDDLRVIMWVDKGAPSIPSNEEKILPTLFGGISTAVANDPILKPQVDSILIALATGDQVPISATSQRVNVLGLRVKPGRIATSFYFQNSLEYFLNNLQRHYEDGHLEANLSYLPVPTPSRILQQVKSGNLRILTERLLKSILTGAPYPPSVFQAVLGRCLLKDPKAKKFRVKHASASFLKAYINRLARFRGAEMPMNAGLDPNCPLEAYQNGRLFAVLQRIQEIASKNRSFEKLFLKASSSPSRVWELVANAKYYLRLCPNDLKDYFEQIIIEIGTKVSPPVRSRVYSDIERAQFVIGNCVQMNALYQGPAMGGDADEDDTPTADVTNHSEVSDQAA